jgi:hypothetical protein
VPVAASLLSAAVFLWPAAAGSAETLTPSSQSPTAVPTTYQAEYAAVQAEVDAFAAPASHHGHPAATTFGAELLSANGNIGSALLRPDALSGVEEELDAFQALGITGVTVDVSFPLLVRSTPDSAQYLAFYEDVADQIRLRHLAFSVEENPIFVGTPLTTLALSYAGLTIPSYTAEARGQAQTIIDRLHPDYLSVLTEPDTYTDALHLTMDTPASAVAVVRAELAGLHRARTKVGAGTGTWSSPAIDRALLSKTSINYLDVHVYPIGPGPLDNLAADVSMAKAAKVPLVMDETWLNKPSAGQGLGPAGAPENLKVKSFSFWEPLDEQYVSAMVSYARSAGFAYVAFFDGARAFFGYLDWSPALEAASYSSFSAQYNQLVAANMVTRTVSGTGLALVQALKASPPS